VAFVVDVLIFWVGFLDLLSCWKNLIGINCSIVVETIACSDYNKGPKLMCSCSCRQDVKGK
jgi:hypothetical protein